MKKNIIFLMMLIVSVALRAQNLYGTLGNHQYVDLGLSVLWATTNIGANTPEDFGDYYSWGEYTSKLDFSKDAYEGYRYTPEWDEVLGGGKDADGFEVREFKFHHESETTWPFYGKDISGSARDVASVLWGGGWRMPTQKEMLELIKKCKWEWTTKNDVRGYKVTGPNGSWIFLPAAGFRSGLAVNRAETRGYYWTATMPEKDEVKPHYLYLGMNKFRVYNTDRYQGLSVRAVCPR